MGREVRKVPADWQHPKDERGRFTPLFDGADFAQRLADWLEDKAKWDRGEFPDYASEDSRKLNYEDWDGDAPNEADYMLVGVPAEDRTHFMMYEDTSEGTPISPAFSTIEELARWLTDNNASAFGGMTASYEAWLATCKRGSAMSMMFSENTGLITGVDANLKS